MTATPRSLAVALLTALLAAGTACETPKEGMVGEPPPDDGVQMDSRTGGPRRIRLRTDDKKLPKKTYPDALFGAPLWPYVEEGTTFELTWNAAPGTLEVHEKPDPNSAIAGEYALKKGQRIPWRSTWVGVYKPALFRAETRVEFDGTRYAPGNPDRNEAPVSETVHPGETIAVYLYAGATTCYVGVGQTLMLTACPTPNQFAGDFSGRTRAEQMHPEKRIWWVYIETQKVAGWIPIGDRVMVDIIRT